MLIVWHYVITCYNAYHCYMFKKYTCWIPIGYCKQLVMVMAVFFVPCQEKAARAVKSLLKSRAIAVTRRRASEVRKWPKESEGRAHWRLPSGYLT